MTYSIFALELAARTFQGDPLRNLLHQLVISQPEAVSAIQKRQLYAQICNGLTANFGAVEKGCWDYFDDHQKAQTDFDMWLNGMLTEEGARQQPSYEPVPRYLTFTMAFLLVNGTATDLAIRQRCQVPEQNLWRRDVFAYIVQAVPAMDFTHVQSDVMYLIPRDEPFALTPDDLAQQKFHYLRQLV